MSETKMRFCESCGGSGRSDFGECAACWGTGEIAVPAAPAPEATPLNLDHYCPRCGYAVAGAVCGNCGGVPRPHHGRRSAPEATREADARRRRWWWQHHERELARQRADKARRRAKPGRAA